MLLVFSKKISKALVYNDIIIYLCENRMNRMYLGKREIFNKEEYELRRKACLEFKPDATITAFSELEDIINKTQLVKQYFGKSQSWFSQRLNGCTVLKKSVAFKEEEFHQLAEAFRDIAKRLQAHADEIDKAKL